MSESDGTFTISRRSFWRKWRRGELRWGVEALPPPSATDPDTFMPDGDPRAAARWADDGGRA